MNLKDSTNEESTTAGIVHTKKVGRKTYIIISALCFSIVAISSMAILRHDQKKTSDSPAIPYKETITPDAYGHALGARLTGFYFGGNADGVEIPAHKYYPSSSDLKNPKWTKKYMHMNDDMNQLIADGTITYEARDCDNRLPSGENNKCTSFILKSGDSYTFDSIE